MGLLTFADALHASAEYSHRHLLLGNGFSIACRPDIFTYKKLYEEADFSQLSKFTSNAFQILKTQDFEKVIKTLKDTALILEAYGGDKDLIKTLKEDAEGLKEILVQTIASNHPAWPGDVDEAEYAACREFLSNFERVYTLNYDLLLYWAMMHISEGEEPTSDDGFRKPYEVDGADYVTWDSTNSHSQNTFYLHGALHLFDTEAEIQKYTWINTNIRLIDQIREALNRNNFPIFVSEGTSKEKFGRVRHNDYLSKGYRSFVEIGGCLFIYGHSLAANDDHYIKRIGRGKLDEVYIGIYGDPDSAENQEIIAKAKSLSIYRGRKKAPLKVTFFDASSADVWGHGT